MLGFIAAAVLALSGLWAGSASALMQHRVFEANSYPAKITGTQEGVSTLTTAAGSVHCKTSLSGEIGSTTGVASLGLSGYCEPFGGISSFKMSACNVELTPGWNAFGFGPSGCGPITISMGVCTLSIPSQTGLYATYKGVESGVEVSLRTNRLRYSGCNQTDSETGSFEATWTLSGVTMGAPFEESLFAAERYPATVVGSQEKEGTELHVINTEAGTIRCTNVTFGGSLSGAANPLSLSPTYSGCGAFGFTEASVTTNGCSYAYWLDEEGGLGGYPMDINCPAGKEIVVKTATCTMAIPPQSGRRASEYANLDSSPTGHSEIEITSKVANLTYTVTKDGFLCPFNGTGTRTTGTYTGKTLLQGQNGEGRPMNIKIGA